MVVSSELRAASGDVWREPTASGLPVAKGQQNPVCGRQRWQAKDHDRAA